VILQLVASAIAGALCGLLGFYINELKLTTLSFSIAHAALAGASMSIVLGFDTTYTAISLAMVYALALGLLMPRVGRYSEALSMTFFTLFNALALAMIYLGQTTVLATARVGGILWGHILAITPIKLALLGSVTMVLLAYIAATKRHLDAIVFDRRIAEAEGVNVYFHIVLLLLFVGLATALTLVITGGFLLFTLLYIPIVASAQISLRAYRRQWISSLVGSVSSAGGLIISYCLDLPVGASIALTALAIMALSTIARLVANAVYRRKVKNEARRKTVATAINPRYISALLPF